VDLSDNDSTFSDCRRNAFRRSCPHIADGEYPPAARLERQDRLGIDASARCALSPRDHEPFAIDIDTAVEPGSIRVGPDEEEQVTQRTGMGFSARARSKDGRAKAGGAVPFKGDHLGSGMENDIGQSLDAVD
jgi:hypothetical protein